ncbi:MAG: IPT/TIG domain-containing protein [Bacteroidales bacterium]|nr:IPT/TIG domain-containing protein [Bacteroidales bacterium]
MKKIFKLLGICLSVVLMGAASVACAPEDLKESADLGLTVKVFFPTKVVAGQPMTINGSGFTAATEIVFPGNVSVTSFERVSNDMIRVIAPAGISADGGKIIVKTNDAEAESIEELTIGKTVVTGYSKEPGEKITGGEQLTIYGVDLEFITAVELLDSEGEPLFINHENFYRKGSSSVVIYIPKLDIYEGSIIGKIHTYDGQVIDMAEFEFEPGAAGGHWETNRIYIWQNDGTVGPASWASGSPFRYALEGHDGNNECCGEIPADLWERMKTETFHATFTGSGAQIRIVTGWWSDQYKGGADADGDYRTGSECVTDNGDNTYTIEINLAGSDLAAAMDEKHFLFAGDGFTIEDMYFEEEVWVDEGGIIEVEVPIWENDGTVGPASWASGSPFRYALEGHDGSNECCGEIPADLWERMKTETFYMNFSGDGAQIRIVTGWWSDQYKGGADADGDYRTSSECVTANEDGTYTIEINLAGSDLAAAMDEKHFLFAGNDFTVNKMYFIEQVVSDGKPQPKPLWDNDGTVGPASWASGSPFRFALEGHDGSNECCGEISPEGWEIMKTKTFYATFSGDGAQIRIVTGWWSDQYKVGADEDGDYRTSSECVTDNGDGTYTIEINLAGSDLAAAMDEKHFLFAGNDFTILSMFYY